MNATTTPKRRISMAVRWVSLTLSLITAAILVGAGHFLAAALVAIAQTWLG